MNSHEKPGLTVPNTPLFPRPTYVRRILLALCVAMIIALGGVLLILYWFAFWAIPNVGVLV